MAQHIHITETIENALREIESHAGEEGYRHTYDKALHIQAALHAAGLKIVRDPRAAPKPL